MGELAYLSSASWVLLLAWGSTQIPDTVQIPRKPKNSFRNPGVVPVKDFVACGHMGHKAV